jgi:hypothetical protein
LDAARRGSALLIDGDQSPRPDLEQAASMVAGASDEATAAVAAASRVAGTLAAVAPEQGPLPAGPSSALLPGISAQLVAAGRAAVTFVERRHATEATLDALSDALASLDDDDPQGALRQLAAAEQQLEALRDWERPPTASLAGDAGAVRRAARRYARAADEAHRADTALAIAIAESGSSLAATPMQLLADALEAATEQRQALDRILAAG